MPEHKRTIEIVAYTANDGKPVCCLNFSTSKTCTFLRAYGVAVVPFCAMYEKRLNTYYKDPTEGICNSTMEYIAPLDECELHA